MIFYNALKLLITTFVQVFRIIFYCLVAFLLVFGCMFSFAYSYFSILVHSRFFDNIIEIINGLFIDLNVSRIYEGALGIGQSVREYFEILSIKGFAIEIVIGCALVILLFLLIFWFRFGICRTLREYTVEHKKKSPFKEMIKNPKESFNQIFASLIFTGIYDVISVFLMFNLIKYLLTFSIANSIQYSILFAFAILLISVRVMIFNGWEYMQNARNISATRALLRNLRYTWKNLFTMFYNAILLVLFSWIIFVLCGQVLVGYLIIVAFAITYLLSKCYGVATYYYYTKEPFYIMGKKCSFRVGTSLINKKINSNINAK